MCLHLSVLLVNDDACVQYHKPVDPGCIRLRDVDTPMRPLRRERIASRILMWEIGPWTVVGTPPAVMKKVALTVVLDGIVNRRIRIPVG